MNETPPNYLVRSGRSSLLAIRVAVLLLSVVGVPLLALWGGQRWSAGHRTATALKRPPVSEPSHTPGPTVPSDTTVDARIVEMLHRLQRAGALYYRLDREADASGTGGFVFQCRMDGAEGTFSAAEPDAILAIGRVLGQVDEWLAAAGRPEASRRIETARRDDDSSVRR